MRPVPRISVTCALPGCGKQIELTQYQRDRRGHHSTCSYSHAGLLSSLDGIRQDDAGEFLAELMVQAGGHEALAHQLRWPRVTLQKLERTLGRVPRDEGMCDLARVSGKHLEEIQRIFGPRRDPRTAAIIAAVRERFPRDRVRLAVAASIERDYGTIGSYARAIHQDDEILRMWLVGENEYLREPTLRAIAAHEHLPDRVVARTLRKAKKHWGKSLTRGRRKWSRRKRHPTSDEARLAKSRCRKELWSDPAWRRVPGDTVIEKMQEGRRRAWANEERHLAHQVKRIVGRYTAYFPFAKPEDALWVLCQILRRHRARFPDSPVTVEALPEKVRVILGRHLHTVIHAVGRPYDVAKIAKVIKLFGMSPQPDPFWPEASRRLYGTRHRADDAWRWWHRFERSVSEWTRMRTARPRVDLMRALFEEILGREIDPEIIHSVLRIAPGRPAQTSPVAV